MDNKIQVGVVGMVSESSLTRPKFSSSLNNCDLSTGIHLYGTYNLRLFPMIY